MIDLPKAREDLDADLLKNPGGYVIPVALMDDIREELSRHNPYRPDVPAGPRKRPSLRVRWRLFRLTFTGRLHDWMFPSCRPDDEYDG